MKEIPCDWKDWFLSKRDPCLANAEKFYKREKPHQPELLARCCDHDTIQFVYQEISREEFICREVMES